MQGTIDFDNYEPKEPFGFQPNAYSHETVSQDIVATYDCTSTLQGMPQAEPPFLAQPDSIFTTPRITYGQILDELLSIQNYTPPYSMSDTQFYAPEQNVRNGNTWYNVPNTLVAPQQIAAAPPLTNFPRAEDPITNKQSTDQITLPTVFKSSISSVRCFNCKVTRTPLWRRTPDREHLLCNACGLYYKQTGRCRSTSRNRQQRTKVMQQKLPSPEKEAFRCVNCNRTETPLWRKNSRKETICNACGLYAKVHKKDRPAEMHKTEIQHRRPSSFFDIYDNSETYNAVTRALSSGFNGNDPKYISEVINLGTKDAVKDELKIAKSRCDFLEVVLSYMENNNHPPEERCNV